MRHARRSARRDRRRGRGVRVLGGRNRSRGARRHRDRAADTRPRSRRAIRCATRSARCSRSSCGSLNSQNQPIPDAPVRFFSIRNDSGIIDVDSVTGTVARFACGRSRRCRARERTPVHTPDDAGDASARYGRPRVAVGRQRPLRYCRRYRASARGHRVEAHDRQRTRHDPARPASGGFGTRSSIRRISPRTPIRRGCTSRTSRRIVCRASIRPTPAASRAGVCGFRWLS